ncbi:MAG: hypothetical protein WCJ95_20670 [Mariniphaga sp.]
MPILTPKYNTATEEQVHTMVEEPVVKLDQGLKDELLSEFLEEGMVIVHCSFDTLYGMNIRIWSSTFLIDKASGDRSRMLHAENITIAPVWMEVPAGSTARFTLIFSPLPRSCEFFDLLEDIPQSGGFFIQNIKRNKEDVYQVKILGG